MRPSAFLTIVLLLQCYLQATPVAGPGNSAEQSKVLEGPRVAVVPFVVNGDVGFHGAGDVICDVLVSKLDPTKVKVIERIQLSEILDECDLTLAGVVENPAKLRNCSVSGVDLVLLGSVSRLHGIKICARLVDLRAEVERTAEADANDPAQVDDACAMLAERLFEDGCKYTATTAREAQRKGDFAAAIRWLESSESTNCLDRGRDVSKLRLEWAAFDEATRSFEAALIGEDIQAASNAIAQIRALAPHHSKLGEWSTQLEEANRRKYKAILGEWVGTFIRSDNSRNTVKFRLHIDRVTGTFFSGQIEGDHDGGSVADIEGEVVASVHDRADAAAWRHVCSTCDEAGVLRLRYRITKVIRGSFATDVVYFAVADHENLPTVVFRKSGRGSSKPWATISGVRVQQQEGSVQRVSGTLNNQQRP